MQSKKENESGSLLHFSKLGYYTILYIDKMLVKCMKNCWCYLYFLAREIKLLCSIFGEGSSFRFFS